MHSRCCRCSIPTAGARTTATSPSLPVYARAPGDTAASDGEQIIKRIRCFRRPPQCPTPARPRRFASAHAPVLSYAYLLLSYTRVHSPTDGRDFASVPRSRLCRVAVFYHLYARYIVRRRERVDVFTTTRILYSTERCKKGD